MSSAERARLIREFRQSRQKPNTDKQDKFVEVVKETGDIQLAAKTAYPTHSQPDAIVRQNMDKPRIKEEVEEFREKTECRTQNAMEVMGKAMKATTSLLIGEETIEVPDHKTRISAAKEALKLNDAYPKVGGDVAAHLHLHAHMVDEIAKRYTSAQISDMMRAEMAMEATKVGSSPSQEAEQSQEP